MDRLLIQCANFDNTYKHMTTTTQIARLLSTAGDFFAGEPGRRFKYRCRKARVSQGQLECQTLGGSWISPNITGPFTRPDGHLIELGGAHA